MTIGTGMPAHSAFERVPHHLYAFVDPSRRYSAASFVEDADAVIHDVCARRRLPIVVGGTGFYIEALVGTMRLDRPPGDEALRLRLRAEAQIHPVDVLWEWLSALAPAAASSTRRKDSYRILRALEIAMMQRAESAPLERVIHKREPRSYTIARLRVRRSTVRERVARRVRDMFAQGLVHEARAVRAIAVDATALSGLGYAEALAYDDGRATQHEALEAAIRRTEQYAKRQETWFRRMREAQVVDAEDKDAAVASIIALAREKLLPA